MGYTCCSVLYAQKLCLAQEVPELKMGENMKQEVALVLTMVIFFLKCFVGPWAGWILGPTLNGHSSALRS